MCDLESEDVRPHVAAPTPSCSPPARAPAPERSASGRSTTARPCSASRPPRSWACRGSSSSPRSARTIPTAGRRPCAPYLRAKADADDARAGERPRLDRSCARAACRTSRAPASSTLSTELGRRGPVPRADVALVLAGDARRAGHRGRDFELFAGDVPARDAIRCARRESSGRRRVSQTMKKIVRRHLDRAAARPRRATRAASGCRARLAAHAYPPARAGGPSAARPPHRPPGPDPRLRARLVLRAGAAPLRPLDDDGGAATRRARRSASERLRRAQSDSARPARKPSEATISSTSSPGTGPSVVITITAIVVAPAVLARRLAPDRRGGDVHALAAEHGADAADHARAGRE